VQQAVGILPALKRLKKLRETDMISFLRLSQTFLLLLIACSAAKADPIRIVAIGDSNYGAPGVSRSETYPAQLEAALRARGVDAQVTNAGINGDTSAGVLARLDSSVPNGTDVALVSVGVNDIKLHGASQGSVNANVAQIVSRLRARGVEVVLQPTGRAFQGSINTNPKFHVEGQDGSKGPKPGTTNWHLTPQGYAMVVARTLPQVMAAIAKAKSKKKKA
jgi:acyl-CoA thioesterase-1